LPAQLVQRQVFQRTGHAHAAVVHQAVQPFVTGILRHLLRRRADRFVVGDIQQQRNEAIFPRRAGVIGRTHAGEYPKSIVSQPDRTLIANSSGCPCHHDAIHCHHPFLPQTGTHGPDPTVSMHSR
jgi:hypothetical protein